MLKNSNLNWLLANRFIVMPFEIVVGVMMARYLGPENLGKLTYVINITTILSIITTFGLDNVIVKLILEKKNDMEILLGTAIVFRFITSLMLVVIVNIYSLLRIDDSTLRIMLFIVSCGYFFQSFKVIDFYFQAISKCKFTVISQKLSLFSGYSLKLYAVLQQFDIVLFAVITFLSDVILAIFNIIFFQKYNQDSSSIKNWKYSFNIAKLLFVTCWPLALSGLAIHIYTRFDQVLLQEFIGSKEAGLYAASGRILSLWYFVTTAFGTALYPKVVYAKLKSKKDYSDLLQHYYIVMFWLGLFVTVLMTFIGKWVIIYLYGEKYNGSVLPLTISVWSLIPTFLGTAIGHYLVVENYVKIILYQTIIGSVISLLLNFLLIPTYGAPGAAFALVISFNFATFSYLFFPKTWENAHILINVLNPSSIKASIKKIFR